MAVEISFENSFARLPERFFARVAPTPVRAPALIRVNRALAFDLGLDADWLASQDGVEMLSGQRTPTGSEPIALAYAGHQFGHFVRQLGDGRAILLGEVIARDGQRRDIQLKGAGPTPFSRRGDGRAALGPVLREYVVSEAMAALGVPTTRALAAVRTGEPVIRETALPGAVLARVALSHIRVGTFQFFAARDDREGLRLLADHLIARRYPNAAGAERPYKALLDAIVSAQAELIAQWLLVGFIHGVMNTDNMSLAGETIDYGPCAFMDAYDPAMVLSAIDEFGRYAFGNQPRIAHWNLTRLAEAMLPLLGENQTEAVEQAQDALDGFAPQFERAHQAGLRRKLGLATQEEGDIALADGILTAMSENQVDFTLFFRRLSDLSGGGSEEPVRALFVDPARCDAWLSLWRTRLSRAPLQPEARRAMMQAVNPAYIPRNHRIEAMIRAAVDDEDFGPFDELLKVLAAPFEDQPAFARYQQPPEAQERVLQTFCGT